MYEFSLKTYVNAFAGDIEHVDPGRSLAEADLKIAERARRSTLEKIGYGFVRAADVYQYSYNQLQRFRNCAAWACCGFGVSLNLGVITEAALTLEGPTDPSAAITSAAFLVAASIFSIKINNTAENLERQRNLEDVPGDKKVNKKSLKNMDLYLRKRRFAKRIHYGIGFPYTVNPISVRPEDYVSERVLDRELMRSFDAVALNKKLKEMFASLPQRLEKWNRDHFLRYEMGMLMLLHEYNPSFKPTVRDLQSFDKIFYKLSSSNFGAWAKAHIRPNAVAKEILGRVNRGLDDLVKARRLEPIPRINFGLTSSYVSPT